MSTLPKPCNTARSIANIGDRQFLSHKIGAAIAGTPEIRNGAVKETLVVLSRSRRLSKNSRESARGTELRRRQWRKRAKRKSNEQRSLASGSAARRLLRIVEPKPFRALIVPGGVYGGDGAIFAAENPIFQSKNRFLAVFAPGNLLDFSKNWRGWPWRGSLLPRPPACQNLF